MKKISEMLKRTVCALISCSLISAGMASAGAATTSVAAKTVQTSKTNVTTGNKGYIYYVSNGTLYRVMSDGTQYQKLLKSFNFEGKQLKQIGNYLYCMYDENSTTLLRFPVDGSANIPKRAIDDDILYFTGDKGIVYYMNAKGAIYSVSGDAKSFSEAKMVTDMADTKNPKFTVINGRVYYNAKKSGRTTWVASKAANGSGQVQWIAQGSIEDPWFVKSDASSVYMLINTKPEETQYSVNCMVLYTMPIKGGVAKAINPKTPLDTNSVYSGFWANGYFLYNKGIKVGSDKEFDYQKGVGYIMDMWGKVTQLSTKGIYEIANVGTDKLAYVDADGKAYVCTLKAGKVTAKKALNITGAGYVRNLIVDNKVKATMLFAQSGAYMLQSDLSLKKMVGVEWDLCMYKDDVSGFFYVNAGDNGRLYHMNEDGKTGIKLSDDKIERLVLISKVQ